MTNGLKGGRVTNVLRVPLSYVKETLTGWSADKAPQQAAALAFYSLLALAPLLIIAVGIAGLVLGEGETRQALLEQIDELAGPQVAGAVRTVLDNASRPAASTAAFVIGGVLLLFGASGAVRQLRNGLNAMWNVEPVAAEGVGGKIKGMTLRYLFHFGLVIAIGIGLVVLLAASSGWGWVAGRVGELLPAPELLLRVLDFVVVTTLVTLVVAAVFSVLPDARIDRRDLWLGAAVTAVLFDIGRSAIGVYLSNSATTSAYGAAGSVVALLLWVYYSGLVFFFGAELTQVYARRHGRPLRPKPGARNVTAVC